MEIDEHPIPEAVVSALCRLVDRLDAKQILATSSLTSTIFQGHRVILQNVPVARQRIKSSLKKDRHLDPATATLLRGAGLSSEVVVVLSEAALEERFGDMATYYGEADFLAASLLDEREAVRNLAHDFIAGWDGQISDESRREKAVERVRSTFASFLANIKELQGEAMPLVSRFEKDQRQATKEKPDKVLDAVKADLARLTRKSEGDRKELQANIDQRQKEIVRLRNDLVSARKDSDSHSAALSEAKKVLAEMQAALQQRIDEGVRKALSDRLRQWLEPLRKVDDAIAGARRSDLLGRAVRALEKQRSVDRYYGNRSALARMIEERRQILADVRGAQVEALNLLPELPAIAAELEHEICDLGRSLGQPDEPVTPTATRLLVRVNAAQSLEDLSELRQFIQQVTSYELLNRDELTRLYRAMDDKVSVVYDKLEILGKDQSEHPQTRFFLRQAIAYGESFTLFIDGHNVLYTLKDIFGQHFVGGHPGSMARVELANGLTRIFKRAGSEVLLYFDGNDPTVQSLSDQVRVIYSGGTGEHRADEAILKHLSHCIKSNSSDFLCLVTRDTDLARQASAMGATIIHPEEFAASLDIAAA